MTNKNKLSGKIVPPGEPKPKYVYFVQDERTKLIKIGTSGFIETRLKTLEWKYKTTLKFLGRVDGHLETEREMHKRFWAFHHSGEWFYPEPELLNFIENHTNPSLPQEEESARYVRQQFYLIVEKEPFAKEILKHLGLEGKSIALVHISVNYKE